MVEDKLTFFEMVKWRSILMIEVGYRAETRAVFLTFRFAGLRRIVSLLFD